ncbi:hypothetical protein SCAZ3_01800 [Streptococcus canis FSL Z3-227]|uniref:Uncharacterized protein n=1 Tax=Streptococcus canis FSL Z3-227 TaxID=482234 RepID=A0AAV3FQS4_STRCB|nr:hypothetical protein SCAZ3_01800 [Streptococcus canis FSL Z3-227]
MLLFDLLDSICFKVDIVANFYGLEILKLNQTHEDRKFYLFFEFDLEWFKSFLGKPCFISNNFSSKLPVFEFDLWL